MPIIDAKACEEHLVPIDSNAPPMDNPFKIGMEVRSLLHGRSLGKIRRCSLESRAKFLWAEVDSGLFIYSDAVGKTVSLFSPAVKKIAPCPFLPGTRVFKLFSKQPPQFLGAPTRVSYSEFNDRWLAYYDYGVFTSTELTEGRISIGQRNHDTPFDSQPTSTPAVAAP